MDDELQRSINEMDAMYLVAMDLTGHLPHGQACGCTGLEASWCPIHGDCICDVDLQIVGTGECPLHGAIVQKKKEWIDVERPQYPRSRRFRSTFSDNLDRNKYRH